VEYWNEYQLVISDIKMPELDGIALLEKTSKISPETYFIVMTAYASVETAISALRNGAYDYLLKPIEFDDIINKKTVCYPYFIFTNRLELQGKFRKIAKRLFAKFRKRKRQYGYSQIARMLRKGCWSGSCPSAEIPGVYVLR